MKFFSLIMLVLVVLACNQPTEKVPEAAVDSTGNRPSPELLQQLSRINQYPDSTSLRVQAIEVLDSIGALREAISQVDILIKKDSLHAGYWTKKGELSEKIGDTTTALMCYRYAARIYPSPDLMLRAANLLAEQKNDTTLLLLQTIAREWNDRTYLSHVAFIKGVYYARKGNPSKAHQSFEQCIAINYHYLEAYMEKGFLYWDTDNIAAAQKVFKTVIQLKSTYPDGYYWLAKCDARLQDTAAAKMHYQQAQRLDAEMPIPAFASETPPGK
jgi:tetratricopeptide (TPR) repeat protein